MKLIFSLLIMVVGVQSVNGQSDQLRKQHFNIKKNVALEGYDAVSYFDGKPLEGDPEIKFVFKNITYQFASAANMAKFKASPDNYEPAYGGWCAYAMGESGEKVKIDPETFKILDGKLYLFYNFWGNNTLEDWKANEKKLKVAADHNWKNIVR
ncbi:MAG TPA: YHS domain-containing (seleno)protein [Chryseolinea sp.]